MASDPAAPSGTVEQKHNTDVPADFSAETLLSDGGGGGSRMTVKMSRT